MYSRRVRASGGTLKFADLNDTDLAEFGLTSDQAARRLYVVQDGTLLAGVDAFIVLWKATPGFGWLARVASVPGVRQVAGLVYEGVLAPVLFSLHKRRQSRSA